ncbi:Zn-ribbon domain-containing OB-fold protein [Pseudonocardia sp. N23]|uniref:Zn-ribbon domain-containing OB-fold protein n=1 Tax=Pseudonocardia sp. N23 TaxID=1987376 RepID=UPI000BFB31BC|nr:OB-fold domain-containing protein [Pseudonocardia sp. N23]
MTSIIERHYRGLAGGIMYAHRCTDCYGLTFPMTTCCDDCGSFTYEEVRLAGRGVLLFASHTTAPASHPRFVGLAPYVLSHVLLDEGIATQGVLTGVDPTPDAMEDLYERRDVLVELDVLRTADLPVIAFRIR